MDALEPFKIANYPQDPTPLPYLQHADDFNFDINLKVAIKRTAIQNSFFLKVMIFQFRFQLEFQFFENGNA